MQVLLGVLIFLQVAAATTCYYPDGSSVSNHSPCTAGNGTSMCCSEGQVCLSSGMCQAGPKFSSNPYYATWPYVRGACTDQTWQSNGCLKHCQGYNIDSVDSICGNDNDGYCCFEDAQNATASSCVCTPGKAFMIQAGSVVTTLGPTPSGPAVSNARARSTISSSTSKTVTPAPATAPATTPTAIPQSSDKATKLGAGIGVPLGVALLIGLGILFWRQRRRHYKQHDDIFHVLEMPHRDRKVQEMGSIPEYQGLHELPGSKNDDAQAELEANPGR